MERRGRSGGLRGSVVTSRSGYGCVGAGKEGDGIGAGSSLRAGKEKKGPRMVGRDSWSSEELEEPCARNEVDKESEFASRRDGFDHFECSDDEDDMIGKKRKLDVFEFDEYDRFDEDLRSKKGCALRGEGTEAEGRMFLSPTDLEAGTSGGGVIVYRRRSSFNGGSSRFSSSINKVTNQSMNKNSDSLFSSKSSNASLKSIRVPGKNGVLKVQVNKPKGRDSFEPCSHFEAEDYKYSKDGTISTRGQWALSSNVLEARFDDQAGSVGLTGKAFLNLHKSMSTRTSHMLKSGFDDSDTSSKSGRDWDSRKSLSVKKSKGKSIIRQKSTPAVSRSRDGMSKRRSGTEKQKLREHIKQMLLDAGWTIDYRPRRNRGYNDTVYINTSGTSYWSIIKAYGAFLKEAADKNEIITSEGDSPFAPLSKTILCKLTRGTRQNMENENKMKHHKNGRSCSLKQTSSRRPLKSMSDSEEITSDENEEENYEEEEENLKLLNNKCGKSPKGRNGLNRTSGSRHLDQFSHDVDLMCGGIKNSYLKQQARKNKKAGRCTLLVRSANKGTNTNDGYVPYTGKRTLLSWLIDCGTVGLSEKIRFMNRTRKRALQQGRITRDGIHCICCNKVVTIAKFENHAGSKLRQPFQNIITESGVSLLQCLLEAWNQQAQSSPNYFHNVNIDGDDPNDDTCSICGDGGDLICCDGCPSTFHQNCLDIEILPVGDWHCPQCICVHCGVSDESGLGSDTSKRSLQTCSLCEMKYHISCPKEVDSCDGDSFGSPFCGADCHQLHKSLQKSVGVRNELEEGFSWSLIRRTIVESDDSINENPLKIECNAKLAVAQTIMDECFLPIVDRRSQVNLIHNVLYNCGSNFNRLNYKGFYTAILEKGDEVISAASLRFHGARFAEMPFIGTRHIYRRQGMCRRLFSAIESALCLLKVEKLVIPAISELLQTWTEVFGFNHLEQSDKEKLKSCNIMVFPGVDILQKAVFEKVKLEDEAVVKTELHNEDKESSGLMCEDPGVLINGSPIPKSPVDGKHAWSEPGNGIANYINESCFLNEPNKMHVDDGIVTDKKASGPLDCPPGEEVYAEDENTASGTKYEEKKPESQSETKFFNGTNCITADAKIEEEHMSQSVVDKGVHLVGEADNNNNNEPAPSVGCVNSYTCDDFAALIPCTDKKVNSRDCLEQCAPPHPEAVQALATEVTSTTTQQEVDTGENSGDATPFATKSSAHTSNGDTHMEVETTPCDNSATSKETDFALHLCSNISVTESVSMETESQKVASAPVEEDVDTTDSTNVVINGVGNEKKGRESEVTA